MKYLKCWICGKKAIYYNPQNKKALCDFHFKRYFDNKVFKTITKYKMINKDDRIAVALSGEKDSMVLLSLLLRFTKKYGQKLFVITIDEGIGNYRKNAINKIKSFLEENKVEHYIFSYKKEFGYSLPEMLKYIKEPPCRICGVLRRYLLNKKSRELGATKLATGHNLNDEAESILLNIFRGKITENAKLGPITGINFHKKFVPRIKPLYFMRVKEILTYANQFNIPYSKTKCEYMKLAFRYKIRKFIEELDKEYPGTLDKIVNGNLEVISYLRKGIKGKVKTCKICGEPTSNNICQTCQILEKIEKFKFTKD